MADFKCKDGADIVVSGIAGKFPSCDNIEELKQKLFDGVEMSSEEPWGIKDGSVPERIGKLKTIKKFDASFFGLLPAVVNSADPMSRMLLESAFEALIDAGINPSTMKGKKCAVYIGCLIPETSEGMHQPRDLRYPNDISTFTFALNYLGKRVSYWLGTTGPSMVVDAGCASSMLALHCAIRDIQCGVCDSALVGSANIIIKPFLTQYMKNDKLLSQEGRCRSYDAKGDGFSRSEAVAMIFIQKKDVALRSYCKLVYLGVANEGFKEQGMLCTSGSAQANLMQECYKVCGVDPLKVDYVDGHGPGTSAGDPEEVSALDRVFTKGRAGPLLLGSVKANVGHTECAAALVSLIKIILAMETGKMPGTLHYETPNPNIPALVEGRIKVNNTTAAFEGTYCAINAFGMGGGICHLLVKRDSKPKQLSTVQTSLPWLICCSGRTEESVATILTYCFDNPVDPEFYGLLHEIYAQVIPNHPYRGHIVLDKKEGISIQDTTEFHGRTRPICFFFSGMGSQWLEMGKELMAIPAFKHSIEQSAAVLKTRDIDLYRIVCSEEPGIFEYILNSFVGITSIQIALFDVLHFLGVNPDYIIGHSFGEISCAYADGSFTAEEAILASYYRGLVSVETVFPPGAMAVVGKGYEEIRKQIPEGIEIACHNSPSSCTISGRKQVMKTFCEWLTKQGCFVSQLATSGIAYHSSLITEAGSKLLGHLKKLLPEPRKRSKKWISSSVPEKEWDLEMAKYSSAEYHVHNFLNPVLFEESFKLVPDDAVVIEVAPRGLMQRILNSFENRDMISIPLADNNEKSNLRFFLSSIGRIYQAGGHPQISKLYTKISFPVSRGTPMISPLIRWNHTENWGTCTVYEDEALKGIRRLNLDAKDCSNAAYTFNNTSLLPYARSLVLAWEAFAAMLKRRLDETDVTFTDIVFYSPLIIESQHQLKAVVNQLGDFIVLFNNKPILSGKIVEGRESIEGAIVKNSESRKENFLLPLKSSDIYLELKLRGIQVNDDFQVIRTIDHSLATAEIETTCDWVKDIESFIHFGILQSNARVLHQPASIKKLVVSPTRRQLPLQNLFQIRFFKTAKLLLSDAIQMFDLKFSLHDDERKPKAPLLEQYQWLPNITETGGSEEEGVQVCFQIICENLTCSVIRSLEIVPDGEGKNILSLAVRGVACNMPSIQYEPAVHGRKAVPNMEYVPDLLSAAKGSFHILIATNPRSEDNDHFDRLLHPDGFVLLRATVGKRCSVPGFIICADYNWDSGRLILLRRKLTTKISHYVDMSDEESCTWLKNFQENILKGNRVALVSRNPTSGIIGFLNSVLQECDRRLVSGVFIMDEGAPAFSVDLKFYSDELSKGLTLNVLKNGVWGTFRFLTIQQQKLPFEHALWKSNTLIEGPFGRLGRKNKIDISVYYSVVVCEEKAPASLEFDNGKYLAAFSGRKCNGARVMGLAINKFASVTSEVEPCPNLLWDVPISWTLRDAASVPFVYCQALMCLRHLKDLSGPTSILISGADSSPVGFALVKVAKTWGISVYATCSNPSMLQLLRFLCPEIDEKEIFLKDEPYSSIDAQGFTTIVDLDGSVNLASMLLPCGSIICLNSQNSHDSYAIDKNCTIIPLDFMAYIDDLENQRYFKEALEKLIGSNILPPLSKVTTMDESGQCSDRDDGNTVFVKLFKWRDIETKPGCQLPALTWKAEPRCWFDPVASYILIGGLGGFGLELASWMAQRGARKFIFCSRTGVVNGYQAYRLRCLESLGAISSILTDDITTEKSIRTILKESMATGSVGGIFHLAVQYTSCSLISNLSEKVMKSENAVKMQAAEYLDYFSRKLCPDLMYFVVFSSYVAGRGCAGLQSYGYCNSRMERLCEKRAKDGYPAKAVQWGPIGDVGVMTKGPMNIVGIDLQPISNCLALLDILLLQESVVVSSCVVKNKTTVSCGKVKTSLNRVCEILGLEDFEGFNIETTLAQMGMDSIVSVQVRNALAREFNINLSIPELRILSIQKLKELDGNYA